MNRTRRIIFALLLPALLAAPRAAADIVVGVLRDAQVQWDPQAPGPADESGFVARHAGQTFDSTIRLPDAPTDQGKAQRIVATIRVRPLYATTEEGRRRPYDPWTRMGSLSVLVPCEETGRTTELEMVRFMTPYGAPAVFEQDVTCLAPHLHGTRTLRTYLSCYSEEPGWTISAELRYTAEGVGPRRPAFAAPLLNDQHVTRRHPTRSARVTVPPGLDVPRIRILSTGHATDGLAGNEFISCTHVLRVDGAEVARWRPWSESGGVLRDVNPTAGRRTIEGRELRSSDLDRSGWHPGQAVEPLIIPLPELAPGPHRIEIEIQGIRGMDPPDETGKRHHGYWALSAAVVADEPWPQ